jgi:hypothetical protein
MEGQTFDVKTFGRVLHGKIIVLCVVSTLTCIIFMRGGMVRYHTYHIFVRLMVWYGIITYP